MRVPRRSRSSAPQHSTQCRPPTEKSRTWHAPEPKPQRRRPDPRDQNGHRRGEGPGPRGLAAPHRAPVHPLPLAVAVVTAIIVGLVGRRPGLAVPAARRHRHRAARPGRAPAGLAGRRHGRRRRGHLGPRRRPDLDQHQGRPAGHARPAHRRLRPPAAPVDRLLHPDPHRRGAVADHQRHRRHAVRRHLDRDLDRRPT